MLAYRLIHRRLAQMAAVQDDFVASPGACFIGWRVKPHQFGAPNPCSVVCSGKRKVRFVGTLFRLDPEQILHGRFDTALYRAQRREFPLNVRP